MSATTSVVDRQLLRSRTNAGLEAGRGRALLGMRVVLVLIAVVAAVSVGLGSTSGLRYALAMGAVYALAALANGVVMGGLGEISLSTSAWLAVGAYVCGLALEAGWAVGWAILASIVVTAIIGFVVAIPTVRLRGIFTALATFVLAWAVPQSIIYLEPITGGSHGLSLPTGNTVLGLPLGGSSPGQLIFSYICFTIAGLVTLALAESRIGRRVVWVGESESAAAVFGVKVTWVKVAVWTWSAAVAGLGGALFALTVGFLSPDQFPATLGINLFVVAVIAGSRSIWGAVLAGVLLAVVPTQLQSFIPSSATGIIFGVILLLALLTGAGGLAKRVEWLILAAWRAVRGGRHA